MPTTSTQSRKSTSTRSSAARTPDAIKLLTQDHKEVKALFSEYEKLVKAEADDSQKQALAEQICQMLTVHAQIEEELLYPAAYEALDEGDLVDEAQVEHASAKDLIAHIRAMQPSDELYDAKVTVLGEYIEHHVKEEEKEMFPKLKKTELDLKELGASLQSRKSELMGEEASRVH
ncbi:MAG TPA: hemerythrin domain-containing protein [Rhizobacter sp.]